jgi:hypothetical protein
MLTNGLIQRCNKLLKVPLRIRMKRTCSILSRKRTNLSNLKTNINNYLEPALVELKLVEEGHGNCR